MAKMAEYLSYWGKAQPASTGDHTWHPAAYHGLDVAAVGQVLLNSKPQLLTALAHVSGLPQNIARSWFLFALSIHDIGKFACCFQAKVETHFYNRSYWEEAKPLGADPGHGRTGLALWEGGCDINGLKGSIFAPLFGTDGDAHHSFQHWMAAVAGHHGRPVPANDQFNRLPLTNLICPEALHNARVCIEDCASLFDMRLPEEQCPPKDAAMQRSSWLVAGLAMLCDWIGSNQEWFTYSAPSDSLADYWDKAQLKADLALNNAGLKAAPVAKRFTLDDALGKNGASATPLQGWAAEVPVTGQSLAIIEDLTGAGKTEAGLILAHRLMLSGAAEGLYWALPTMATADALYHRLTKSYQRLFTNVGQTSLVLAHSASSFNDVFAKSIFTPKVEEAVGYSNLGEDETDDDDITASAACARWLADDRRKTFLADVGIGTIDQALLGVLPSKHQALRLAALSRRVLVIDEAHSYDPYMTRLLESLLEFQGALGGSAIVMSATLTMEARQRFAAAFARGAGWSKPQISETGFPLATLVAEGQPIAESVLSASRGTRRDLPINRLDDEAAAIATLKQAASDGYGAVWIRNTVQDALDGYQALREALPEAAIDLFHARFALGDRLAIEKQVLANFGKDSEGAQRRHIVIATQVVEQSLDCDWDVMISDLAPADLLIQRAGRLHRHDHRPSRPAPLLHIVGPEPTSDAGPKWYERAFPRAAYVYPHHGQLWLTMRALIDAGGLNLATQSPRDIIERVFASEAPGIPEGLIQQSGKAEGKASSERAMAGMNMLALKLGYVPQAGPWESDTRTPTRLGELSRVLRLAKWDGARLTPWWPEEGDMRRAWRLSEVSVRAARVASIDCGQDTVLAKAVAREIASWPEKYDPPLLVPLTEENGGWTAKAIDANDKATKLLYNSQHGLQLSSP